MYSVPPLLFHCFNSSQDSFLGCIDQTYFKDPQTGKDYLLWKTDILLPFRWDLNKKFLIFSNIRFSSSTGFIQELDESGTSFKNGSSKVKIIETDQLGDITLGVRQGGDLVCLDPRRTGQWRDSG